MGSDEDPGAIMKAFPYCDPEWIPPVIIRNIEVPITKDFYMGEHQVISGQLLVFRCCVSPQNGCGN